MIGSGRTFVSTHIQLFIINFEHTLSMRRLTMYILLTAYTYKFRTF